jgi:hypothetical protein
LRVVVLNSVRSPSQQIELKYRSSGEIRSNP